MIIDGAGTLEAVQNRLVKLHIVLESVGEDLLEIEPEAADDGARPVMEAEDAPPASDESA